MLAHGFRSAGLFLIAYLLYLRRHRRSLLLNKNSLAATPGLTLGWFLIIMMNLAAPPTLNLLAELLIIINLAAQIRYLVVGLVLCVLRGTIYSLILFSSIRQSQRMVGASSMAATQGELLNIISYAMPGLVLILRARQFS
jgi:NADH:ubiquinone oxidoreductase subunit 4 (subunit M)